MDKHVISTDIPSQNINAVEQKKKKVNEFKFEILFR